MRLLRKDLQPVTLIKSSGQKYENISVNLQSECGKVLTTNFEMPFEEGDILVKGNVETSGDITGVVYTNMDSAGAWKFELAKNMQAVGINVDLNKFLKW